MSPIFFIVGASLPWFLLPLEKIFPMPHLIEELTKLLIVIAVLQKEKRKRQDFFSSIIIFSLAFSLSESLLYLNNIFLIGEKDLFLIRLITTSILHLFTTALMYFFGKINRFFLIIGFILAVLIHFYYNQFIGGFFL